MAQDNCQKIKLLKLIELLRQQTDEAHPMTTMDICVCLNAMGISCERRTLSKDIALLNEQGYEIMWCWVGKEKGYYVEDRRFSIPELKILIDAVQASSFITPQKTDELISKIADLGSSYQADILKSNRVCFNTRKHTNESIYYNVDYLAEAILQQKKILFRYYDLNEYGERVYRRDGHRYILEPVAMVFHEDNYYLLCYSTRHNSTANYRVDRMDHVEIIDDNISAKAVALRAEVSEYTGQAFKMYAGQLIKVKLVFTENLIGAVYDKFGEETQMLRQRDGLIVARVTVQISPTFWGWLLQFGGQMKVVAPTEVVDEYKKIVGSLVEG